MDKKKLSPKQIFRTLAFQYHLDDVIPLDLLAEIVSALYYPNDPIGEAKLKYKKLLIQFMKEHTNQEKGMTQQQFVKFLQQMTKHSNEEYLRKLADRIFNRYANREDNVIDEPGFQKMAFAFGMKKEQVRQFFLNVADLKNQITREKFVEYMNALMIPSSSPVKK